MLARIVPPFDVGFNWTLHVGGETAVISEVAAQDLYSLGIPIGDTAVPVPEAVKTTGAKLSKKARRLLGISQ